LRIESDKCEIGFAECLYKDGFKNITNIDFSSVAIQEMMNKYNHLDEMECNNIGENFS